MSDNEASFVASGRASQAAYALMLAQEVAGGGPCSTAEVTVYDLLASSESSTYNALRAGVRCGLVHWWGKGIWTPSGYAIRHRHELEDRVLEEWERSA